MRLVEDWRWVFAKAWSIKLALISALLQGATFVVPMVTPPHPSLAFVVFSMLLQVAACLFALAAAGSRVVKQPALREGPPAANDGA